MPLFYHSKAIYKLYLIIRIFFSFTKFFNIAYLKFITWIVLLKP